jgi:hypothetical protein
MSRNWVPILVVITMTAGALACNFTPSDSGAEPGDQPAVSETSVLPVAGASDTPAAEPETVVSPEDTCLQAGDGETRYINEAGGYCFVLPDEYEIRGDTGLDLFAVGPTLATFGMDALVLAFDFSVVGAPGKADRFDAAGWGNQLADEYRAEGFELSVEPYTLSGTGLEGVRVGPLPGMAGGEAIVIRANDTLYSITVYPDPGGYPEYAGQIEGLREQLSSTMRFFPPVDVGVEYATEGEVCPAEGAGTRFVINYGEGWCALIPADWQEDAASNFPGRFVGGPRIGEFWPGQPPFANVVVGYSGPASGITLEEQVEGRMSANGRPDLVERTDAVIGGYPAVILNTKDGPVPEHLALIHANGHMYSVLGHPFDAEIYPDAQAPLESAWNQVIQTIRFFEPYR